MPRSEIYDPNWGGRRPGAGRKPRGGKRITVSVSLAEKFVQLGRALAKSEDVSFSEYLERLLRANLTAALQVENAKD